MSELRSDRTRAREQPSEEPERPNTIRTRVRVRASGDDNVGTTPARLEAEPEWSFRTDNPAKARLTGGYRVKAEHQRKGSGSSRGDRIDRWVRVETERECEEGVEVEDEPNGNRERNRVSPMVRNELQKSEGRGEEPREFGDKTSEGSETTEMEERKCRDIRDGETRNRYRRTGADEVRAQPERTIPQATQGCAPPVEEAKQKWKGGKGVVNDSDRSRCRGRAEARDEGRVMSEIRRVGGEVVRADGSTEG
ncbi:hypothetical protein C8R47DRAFT_1192837 [Mycena vitilis]|nr:hypothetical protein C8R47DRAFT_1192837 [Mycena vitilis]